MLVVVSANDWLANRKPKNSLIPNPKFYPVPKSSCPEALCSNYEFSVVCSTVLMVCL